MAETAVSFLLENVSQLLENHSSLICGVENELRQLMMDLDLLKAYVAVKEGPFGEREIKEVVYELEDTIDAYLTYAAAAKITNFSPQRSGQSHLNVMPEKVRDIITRSVIAPLDKYLATLLSPPTTSISVEQPHTTVKKFPPTWSDRIVGLKDEEDTIIGYLTEPKEELVVISIIGMHGLGKTTLAQKIYQDERIAIEFPIRIWTHVPRNSEYRDVFITILKMFSSQDMSILSDKKLIETSRACLEKEKFLLVVDGVCSRDDWEVIRSILPHGNGRSKVLITSGDNYVGADVDRNPGHRLRFLNTQESWKLLQLEVFGNLKDCPLELEEIGFLVADRCGGLPLQIVVVGGILAGELMKSNDLDSVAMEWKKVYENEKLFMHNERSISDVIELTYSTLPDDLRECFLYMGVFPEGYDISVWTLICLWIAEGFVRPDQGGQSLEETAIQNLYHLISRNLVMVYKINPTGEVKTCRIHGTIRAFCVKKGQEHKLFQEIKRSREVKIRRIYVHSDANEFLSEVPEAEIPSVLFMFRQGACLRKLKYL